MWKSQQYAYHIDEFNALLFSKQRSNLDRGQSRSHYIVAWSDDWGRKCSEKGNQPGIAT